MYKHKSDDYKISVVNYYFDNDVNMNYVCNISKLQNTINRIN